MRVVADMFDFLKRDKRVCGAHTPQFRMGTNAPRPSKTPPMPSVAPPRSGTPVYNAPPMPDTAPCKDGFKSVWFDENGRIHIVDDVYITIGGVEYKILNVDVAPAERIVQDD